MEPDGDRLVPDRPAARFHAYKPMATGFAALAQNIGVVNGRAKALEMGLGAAPGDLVLDSSHQIVRRSNLGILPGERSYIFKSWADVPKSSKLWREPCAFSRYSFCG